MKSEEMTFTVIGLGSMGRRRIRCLKALGYTNIVGFDLREDRRKQAKKEYDIQTFDSFLSTPLADAWFVCTPPDKHFEYLDYASKNGIHCFVEHGISPRGLDVLDSVLIKPSCTMLFHPRIKALKQLVKSGYFGKISNIIYRSGQYLLDWHPYEDMSGYYAAKKETGGAREIVPFELTWLVDIFGVPKVKGYCRKTIDIPGAEAIDDTYNCLMDWGNFLGVMVVDVVAFGAIRELQVIGSKEQSTFNLSALKDLDGEMIIDEQMYIDEVKSFLDGELPNTLSREIEVLNLLSQIEYGT